MKNNMLTTAIVGSLLPLSLWADGGKVYQSGEVTAYVKPLQVAQVKQPALSLNGSWKFKMSDAARWTSIQVPGEVVMQGFGIHHDQCFYYEKSVAVPSDFKGNELILRFNGVYCHARLFINGHFVREHHGGFSRWETNVTKWMKPGRKNLIRLEVTDRRDDVSFGSGYAHHPIGGILRDVELFALPEAHLTDVHVETLFDESYTDATLAVGCSLVEESATDVELELKDAEGKMVPLAQKRFAIHKGDNRLTVRVEHPHKWDAEHPYLYTLTLRTITGGQPTATLQQMVGFREIKVVKDRVLVNGMPVKLRGACRHDIHPTLGRTTTAELDSLDVIRFKQSNMNFVRTSHYPPSENFLIFCDKYGIYVESETAVCFVHTHRPKDYSPSMFQSEPSYEGKFMGQLQEMVKSFRSHPSVLLWSIGNESVYGTNFQKSWDWVKATDKTRPVIFSYPGTAYKEKARVYDILSFHYQDVTGHKEQHGLVVHNFQGYGRPVLFDEWAHPACYTYTTLQHDPNIREFWGQSIDKMWSGLFKTSGGLGGGIWSYIDETFAVPELKQGEASWSKFANETKPASAHGTCVGYGEWGIVDVWRRPKPEFWATKKAYSPVRIESDREIDFTPGQPLFFTVYNRFDHTDLNEIKTRYTYQGVAKTLEAIQVAPHQRGVIALPAHNWKEHEAVKVEFLSAANEVIDTEVFYLGGEKIVYPAPLKGSALSITEDAQQLVVKGDGFEIPFDKESGLMKGAKAGNEVLIDKGPFLHLDIKVSQLTGTSIRKKPVCNQTKPGDWKKYRFAISQQADGVYVNVGGAYKEIQVDYQIKITADGKINISYSTSGVPSGYLREAGLAFALPATIQQLDWHRKGYWSCYPENAFAGNKGSVALYNQPIGYGEQPKQPWQNDTHDYYYWGDAGTNCKQPLTRTAQGMKEHIHFYTVAPAQEGHQVSVISADASVACRMEKMPDEQLMLFTDNRWDYPEIGWGNYCKLLDSVPTYGEITLQFN